MIHTILKEILKLLKDYVYNSKNICFRDLLRTMEDSFPFSNLCALVIHLGKVQTNVTSLTTA